MIESICDRLMKGKKPAGTTESFSSSVNGCANTSRTTQCDNAGGAGIITTFVYHGNDDGDDNDCNGDGDGEGDDGDVDDNKCNFDDKFECDIKFDFREDDETK